VLQRGKRCTAASCHASRTWRSASGQRPGYRE